MLLQIGVALSNLFGGIASRILPTIGTAALNIGGQYVSGLVSRELNRDATNAAQDQIKAQLRAAANAISPLVAPGQTAVFSGGPPTGSAFRPPTLIPPSIQPPQRSLQIDPGLVNPVVSNSFALSRRPVGPFGNVITGINPSANIPLGPGRSGSLEAQDITTPAFLPQIIQGGVAAARGLGAAIGSLGPTGARAMAGLTGTAIGIETGAFVAGQFINPSVAHAPGRSPFTPFPSSGNPLQIGDDVANGVIAPTPTGLPGIGRFQKEANGCRVQWYFFNGQNMEPVDRGQAECVKRDCIFRLDVFRGKFIKLKSRRINPMNVRAFFRAGRRVDAGERICRKMFSEHRKTKTGTVRRKRTKRKK